MARPVSGDRGVASAGLISLLSHSLTILFFVPQKDKLSTASCIHYAVSQLSAFSRVCLSRECPSHLPPSQSLRILQDYMQPSFLGSLP